MDFSIKAITPTYRGKGGNQVVDADPVKLSEEFAKLLVAQITNQSPDNPIDATEIISQNAQMTASLATIRLANQMGHYELVKVASSCVGKQIKYRDPVLNMEMTGIVTAADFTGDFPKVRVDTGVGYLEIPVENILQIYREPKVTKADPSLMVFVQNCLGHNVDYKDPETGLPMTGLVISTDFTEDIPRVEVNGKLIKADIIEKVWG